MRLYFISLSDYVEKFCCSNAVLGEPKGEIIVYSNRTIIWFKILGAIFTASGSIVLSWRAKAILEWVKHCLVANGRLAIGWCSFFVIFSQ